jgi:cytoskeletal protein RodZ
MKGWRTSQGLTLKQASERLGIPLPTIHRLENGAVPNTKVLVLLWKYIVGD